MSHGAYVTNPDAPIRTAVYQTLWHPRAPSVERTNDAYDEQHASARTAARPPDSDSLSVGRTVSHFSRRDWICSFPCAEGTAPLCDSEGVGFLRCFGVQHSVCLV